MNNIYLILVLTIILVICLVYKQKENFANPTFRLQDDRLQKCLNNCDKLSYRYATDASSVKDCQQRCYPN
jgi:hypothetical protein